ncbi:DUF4402 domain-containing protein [Shewanella sp. KT0246]|uniref:DUF4402 domain-containing protein n=1 Tax=Shewanella sp. KT0246 TaxID=2815912 RepID=UPI001BBC6065|nr:DUF4402 domain-containing protein [Shewanella sp. KT0246]GIU47739.1 hypothetical protein TUM4249_01270 [Shewanella sp. KT0246]
MTKKILLSTVIASTLLLSTQAGAEDATGTANFNLVYPITVAETEQMEFGDVSIAADGQCALDYSDTTSGAACVAGGNTANTGLFTVTAADGTVNLSLSAADTSVSGVTFTPTLASATGTVASNTLAVDVGGTLDIVAASAAPGTHALTYTLSVTY